MATEAQYKEALIKAHRKGDTRAAQLFASRIKELRASPQPAVAAVAADPSNGATEVVQPPQQAPMSPDPITPSQPGIMFGADTGQAALQHSVGGIPMALLQAAEYMGLVKPRGGMSSRKMAALRERDYQAGREARGDTGIDAPRIAADVLTGAALPAGAFATPLRAAGSGAVLGMSQPVVDESADFAREKATQGGVGAAAGGILSTLGKIGYKPTARSERVVEQGMRPTAAAFRDKRIDTPESAMNKALFNRSLSKIGKEVPESVGAGRGTVKHAYDNISKEYSDVLGAMEGRLDKGFTDNISAIKAGVMDVVDPSTMRTVDNVIESTILAKVGKDGKISGEQLKVIDKQLREKSAQLMRSSTPGKPEAGEILSDVRDAFSKMLRRTNSPENAERLANADSAYHIYKTGELAAFKANKTGGVFDSNQLAAAHSRHPSKGMVAKGETELSEFVDDVVVNSAKRHPLMEPGFIGKRKRDLEEAGGLLGSVRASNTAQGIRGLLTGRPAGGIVGGL